MGFVSSLERLAEPDGAPLRQAIEISGLFHEATQAKAAARAHDAPADLKGALAALKRELLLAGAGGHDHGAGERPAGGGTRPAPPVPERMLQARGDVAARLPDATSPLPLMARLLSETEAALDRLTLLQFASLPDAGRDAPSPQAAPNTAPHTAQPAPPTRLMLELPFLLDGMAGSLPLVIEEEWPDRVRSEQAARPSGWRIRLAFDLEPLGPVQALVGLQAGALRVAVFAEREATARLARRHAGDLEAALADGPFTAAMVDVAIGSPPPARTRAGHFVDRRT